MKQPSGKRIGLGDRQKEQQENDDWAQSILADNMQTWRATDAEERSGHRQDPFHRRLLIGIYLFLLIVFSVFSAIFYLSFLLPSLSSR